MRSQQKGLCPIALLALLILMAPILLAEEDAGDCRDHPLFNRMPGFFISECDVKEFDSHEFYTTGGDVIAVEGQKTYLSYSIEEGNQPPSGLQVLRNYDNAVRTAGGTRVYLEGSDGTWILKRGGKEIWIGVHAPGHGEWYTLTIIEKTGMAQDIQINAAAMADNLNSSGRVALYGIYFDTDKADLKAESEPTLQEIARLLQQQSALKLYVVGHTDGTGQLQHNLDLSRRRAQAVVDALIVHHGIPAGRLSARGVGPLAPVATNQTEDGRALNRRVELVKQ
ncbi:MAG: OmpA family protein [Acidobacteria bacterium]|nr:OmpA family protein [Acidobacteriota bacterium]